MTSPRPVRASQRGWFACMLVGAVVAAVCALIVLLFYAVDSEQLAGPALVFGLVGLIGGVGLVVIGILWALLRIMLSLDRHPAGR